jgi:tripartite-type tricarboxylate transporter receptor subunit TctC
MFKKLASCTLISTSLILAAWTGTAAAAYPDRPVTLVVSSTPGSPLDILGRLLAAEAGKDLKQTVIVENKAGASGTIAAEGVSRSKPDGYTLLLTLDTLATVNPSIYTKNPFNANTDLAPIAFLGSFSQVLIAPKHLGVSNLKDFAEIAKKRTLNYASAGIGSPGHLTMEAFKLASHLSLSHIPYKGNPPAVNDLLGGQVDTGFLVIAGVLPHIQQGNFIPLAVSGATRNPLMPNVPTLAESGIKGLENFDVRFGYLVYAPKGTPADIINQWNGLLNDALRRPEVIEKFKILDIQATTSTPQDAREWISSNSKKWAEVIKTANISTN